MVIIRVVVILATGGSLTECAIVLFEVVARPWVILRCWRRAAAEVRLAIALLEPAQTTLLRLLLTVVRWLLLPQPRGTLLLSVFCLLSLIVWILLWLIIWILLLPIIWVLPSIASWLLWLICWLLWLICWLLWLICWLLGPIRCLLLTKRTLRLIVVVLLSVWIGSTVATILASTLAWVWILNEVSGSFK
jgi:hypothetical protein